jgi:hypothetical protein
MISHRSPSTLAWLSVALASGCTHITHPARVLPGRSVDLALGRVHDDYTEGRLVREPEPAPDFTVGQIHLREGWVFPSGRGLQLELAGQRRWRENQFANNSVKTSLSIWVDLYAQVVASAPIDAGIGLMVGTDPLLYFMIGKRFAPSANWSIDVAGGSRIGYYQSLSIGAGQDDVRLEPFANLAVTLDRFRLGMFADTVVFGSGEIKLCDDACFRDSLVTGQFAVGAFVGYLLN